ncbi:unnamed protein product, partial [Iphiclides podalirius]
MRALVDPKGNAAPPRATSASFGGGEGGGGPGGGGAGREGRRNARRGAGVHTHAHAHARARTKVGPTHAVVRTIVKQRETTRGDTMPATARRSAGPSYVS